MKKSFFYFSFIFIQTAVLEAALITGLDVVGCGYDVLSLQSKMCIVDTSKIGSSWSNPLYPELNYEFPHFQNEFSATFSNLQFLLCLTPITTPRLLFSPIS